MTPEALNDPYRIDGDIHWYMLEYLLQSSNTLPISFDNTLPDLSLDFLKIGLGKELVIPGFAANFPRKGEEVVRNGVTWLFGSVKVCICRILCNRSEGLE